MKKILEFHDKIRPLFDKGAKLGKLWPLFDAQDTFMFTPGETNNKGSHVRDAIDLKRVMITVVMALFPCIAFGIYNAGLQSNIHAGLPTDIVSCLKVGAIPVLQIIFTSYAVGGFWEVLFSCSKRHEINEGFLVTGMLFPLTLPVTIPLWQVALGISFGVVIGKEIFGGTGMNIMNPALTARAFLFFSYANQMIGDGIWVAPQGIDAVTQATPIILAAQAPAGADAVQVLSEAGYTLQNMFIGTIPGSIGETSTLACLLGAGLLVVTGIGSWRIMVACVLGLIATCTLLGWFSSSPIADLPFHYHMCMGSFAFGAVFMATDPVSGAATNKGKWIYGFLIGFICVVIRVANPAYPEGMMLAILFMNVMAPMIDHYVVEAHVRQRARRLAHA